MARTERSETVETIETITGLMSELEGPDAYLAQESVGTDIEKQDDISLLSVPRCQHHHHGQHLTVNLQNDISVLSVPRSMARSVPELPASSLGIIRLDYKYPAAFGDADCQHSFKYQVIYCEVKGLTFEICQRGELPVKVKKNFVRAIRKLEKVGVSGISGDCGFMMWYQKFARSLTKLPVFMSALCMLPAITCSFGKNEKIAIFTANGINLEPMEDLIEEECGVHIFDKRYIIVGCQHIDGFEAVQKGEWVDRATVMKGIVKKAKYLVKEYDDIRAILFECTELPQFSNAVRVATGLPVYDVITTCNFFMSGVQPSTFGVGACNSSEFVVQPSMCVSEVLS